MSCREMQINKTNTNVEDAIIECIVKTIKNLDNIDMDTIEDLIIKNRKDVDV